MPLVRQKDSLPTKAILSNQDRKKYPAAIHEHHALRRCEEIYGPWSQITRRFYVCRTEECIANRIISEWRLARPFKIRAASPASISLLIHPTR